MHPKHVRYQAAPRPDARTGIISKSPFRFHLFFWPGGEVLDLLRRSVDEFGQTVIMVTHDANAASIADRVVFLKDGRIELDEDRMTRDAIYDTIKDLEVPR